MLEKSIYLTPEKKHNMNMNIFSEKILNPNYIDKKPEDSGILARYYPGIQLASKLAKSQYDFSTNNSIPEIELQFPTLTDEFEKYLEIGKISSQRLITYKNRHLEILNLMLNPKTQTTKTIASIMIVLKLIDYIKRTNETIMILTPTSANKGTALRDAVERAISLGLVDKTQLRILTLIPRLSLNKIRNSILFSDAELRELNPLVVYDGDDSEYVKKIGHDFYQQQTQNLLKEKNIRLWYSLNIDNYRVADSVRAFFDYEVQNRGDCIKQFENTWHAHAVSSAYGLIGYDLGCNVMRHLNVMQKYPGYFLVQHLATPDMVLHLKHNNFSQELMPAYQYNKATGLYEQHQSKFFPQTTFSVDEMLEPTFYSHSPATSNLMTELINKNGGDGIVVSLVECLNRYSQIREILSQAKISLPSDPRLVREWSLIMAMTGVLNAIDRGFIPEQHRVLVHGSGMYREADMDLSIAHKLPSINKNNALEKLSALVK